MAQRYPPERFIVGTGCVVPSEDGSRDRLAADQGARADIAKQIEVKVVQLVEDIQKEESRDEKTTSSYAISVQTKEIVESTLKGVQIVDRHPTREGLQCSVAVLDKQATARRIREEIQGVAREVQSYLAGAHAAEQRGDLVEGLRGYTQAMLSLNRVVVEEGLLRDLGFTGPTLPSRVQIGNDWMDRLQAIRVKAVSGDRQRVIAGHPMPKLLCMQAVGSGGVPVPNLPVKVLKSAPGCQIQSETKTDPRGEASFEVYRAGSGGNAIEEIVIGIDWERLLQIKQDADPPWKEWDKRPVVFTYRLPVPADYQVGVAVFELETGRSLALSPVQAALLDGLQGAGFRTKDLFSMSGEVKRVFQSKPSMEKVRRVLSGKVDILVLGEVSVSFSSRVDDDFVLHRARGLVQGISLSDDRVLATLNLEAKGGGQSDDRAAKKAVAGLGKKLRREIGPALEESLE